MVNLFTFQPPTHSDLLDEPGQLVQAISLDSISVASLEEEEEDSSEEEDTVSLHPRTIKEEGEEGYVDGVCI